MVALEAIMPANTVLDLLSFEVGDFFTSTINTVEDVMSTRTPRTLRLRRKILRNEPVILFEGQFPGDSYVDVRRSVINDDDGNKIVVKDVTVFQRKKELVEDPVIRKKRGKE